MIKQSCFITRDNKVHLNQREAIEHIDKQIGLLLDKISSSLELLNYSNRKIKIMDNLSLYKELINWSNDLKVKDIED